MTAGSRSSSLTRVQPFFGALLTRDASGRTWLPALLAATPHGHEALGELIDAPGWLSISLAVKGASGRPTCFDYPSAPSRELLAWFVEHPERLTWPPEAELSPETERLRRALVQDDPPGSRARAQERARERIATGSAFSHEWWRFEGATMLDCVLMTDRLVITVEGRRTEPLGAATTWYPQRSRLVRTLEAARHLAKERRWASIVISEASLPQASREELERSLPEAAPHLSDGERAEMLSSYLGNLTWREACAAVGLDEDVLPDTVAEVA